MFVDIGAVGENSVFLPADLESRRAIGLVGINLAAGIDDRKYFDARPQQASRALRRRKREKCRRPNLVGAKRGERLGQCQVYQQNSVTGH